MKYVGDDSLRYFNGETPLAAMQEQLGKKGLIKDNKEKYLADGVVKYGPWKIVLPEHITSLAHRVRIISIGLLAMVAELAGKYEYAQLHTFKSRSFLSKQ